MANIQYNQTERSKLMQAYNLTNTSYLYDLIRYVSSLPEGCVSADKQ